MSNARIVWLVVSIALMSAVGISSTIVHQKIWWLVDLKEPGRFNAIFWYASKTTGLYKSYRVHYPGGRLVIVSYLLGLIGLVSVISAAWAIGFFNIR